MRYFLLCIIAIITLATCSDDFKLQGEESSQLVIEGWIEEGSFPVVILTRSLPISTDYQKVDELSNYILRWAKVTVTDGIDTVVLTGKYDAGYFPPYIYTTSHMRGEAGKQYELTVEYRDYYATAVTSIPSVPIDCMFRVEKCRDTDSLFQIKAIFTNNPLENNFYQFFTRVGTSTKQYEASYLGSIDDIVLNNTTEIPVYKGHQFNSGQYSPYFTSIDTVSVKFAHVDNKSFCIWDSYTKMLSLSGNMFLSTSTDMVSNIAGGYGYWCGYAAITQYIVIQDSIGKNQP